MEEVLTKVRDASACPVVVIIRDKKVLLGHRHYDRGEEGTLSVWTCPGGRTDSGETVETTLRREVEEETGIRGLDLQEYLGEFPGAAEGDLVPVFLGTTQEEATNKEPHKFSEWRWFARDEFPEQFINKGIGEVIKKYL